MPMVRVSNGGTSDYDALEGKIIYTDPSANLHIVNNGTSFEGYGTSGFILCSSFSHLQTSNNFDYGGRVRGITANGTYQSLSGSPIDISNYVAISFTSLVSSSMQISFTLS